MTVRFTAENAINAPKLTIEARNPRSIQSAASEITDAVEAILDTYRELRQPDEKFIDALHRIGLDPFKAAANAQRTATARA